MWGTHLRLPWPAFRILAASWGLNFLTSCMIVSLRFNRTLCLLTVNNLQRIFLNPPHVKENTVKIRLQQQLETMAS